jgi:hypothetical protein
MNIHAGSVDTVFAGDGLPKAAPIWLPFAYVNHIMFTVIDNYWLTYALADLGRNKRRVVHDAGNTPCFPWQ